MFLKPQPDTNLHRVQVTGQLDGQLDVCEGRFCLEAWMGSGCKLKMTFFTLESITDYFKN